MLVAEIKPDFSIAPAELASPSLPENGALLRLSGCGLCGSDLEKFAQKKAPAGLVLGHEVVGIIEALAEGHGTDFKVGDRIVTAHHTPCGVCHYCRFGSESMCRTFKKTNIAPGGFSEIIALSQEHLYKTAFKVPGGVSDEAASCTEPLACVLKAVDRLGLQAGQSVLVIGLGFIGLLAAQILHNRGIQVIGIDLDQERLDLATRHRWLNQAIDAKDGDTLRSVIQEQTELGKVDAVFFSVVNPKTLETAFEQVRDGGKFLLFASASQNKAVSTTLDPSVLYFREISVITSYSPSLAHLAEAASLIFNGKINVAPLITHRFPLNQIADAMSLYQSGQSIKVFITP